MGLLCKTTCYFAHLNLDTCIHLSSMFQRSKLLIQHKSLAFTCMIMVRGSTTMIFTNCLCVMTLQVNTDRLCRLLPHHNFTSIFSGKCRDQMTEAMVNKMYRSRPLNPWHVSGNLSVNSKD